MPPSGFSRESVNNAVEFVRGCFDDLVESVLDGEPLLIGDDAALLRQTITRIEDFAHARALELHGTPVAGTR